MLEGVLVMRLVEALEVKFRGVGGGVGSFLKL